jgi:hypothetical protein
MRFIFLSFLLTGCVTFDTKCECGSGVYDPTSQQCRRSMPLTELVCTAYFDPVCGCNGRTYANTCEAYMYGVKSFTKGICGEVDL